MSSSGVISGIKSSPITQAGEESRKSNMQGGAAATVDEKVVIEKGIVRQVHPTGLKVKATTTGGQLIANGQWITLDYSPIELSQIFGDIEIGDVVRVFSVGIGGNPSATIIGKTGEEPEKAIRLESKVKLGVGPFLFPPGIGIG